MESFESFTFELNYNDEKKEITVKPYQEPVKDNMPQSFEVAINGFPRGKVKLNGNEWESADIMDKKFLEAIGKQILDHYKQ